MLGPPHVTSYKRYLTQSLDSCNEEETADI